MAFLFKVGILICIKGFRLLLDYGFEKHVILIVVLCLNYILCYLIGIVVGGLWMMIHNSCAKPENRVGFGFALEVYKVWFKLANALDDSLLLLASSNLGMHSNSKNRQRASFDGNESLLLHGDSDLLHYDTSGVL